MAHLANYEVLDFAVDDSGTSSASFTNPCLAFFVKNDANSADPCTVAFDAPATFANTANQSLMLEPGEGISLPIPAQTINAITGGPGLTATVWAVAIFTQT